MGMFWLLQTWSPAVNCECVPLRIISLFNTPHSAKYPLAVLDKVNKALGPGKKLIAYDIGCTFKKTIAKSGLRNELDADYTIPAMHGYTHNRLCQCSHHPKYVTGTGLEDFKTCERFFSVSNDCACVTRHATHFHRHQLIDMFLSQWSEDKFPSSAQFIVTTTFRPCPSSATIPLSSKKNSHPKI